MKNIFIVILLTFCIGRASSQVGQKSLFDANVLKKIQDQLSKEEGLSDAEALYNELSSLPALQTWINQHTSKSSAMLRTSIAKKNNIKRFVISPTVEEKTKHIFFDQQIFDAIPFPDFSGENTNERYELANAVFFSDKKAGEEQAEQVLEEAGINDMFWGHKLSPEGDELTRSLFLTKSSKDGKAVSVGVELRNRALAGKSSPFAAEEKIYRPLRDKAMLLETKYMIPEFETSYFLAALDDESRYFEQTIVAWSPLADFYPVTEEEQSSQQGKAAKPYKIARAILLRMCQERILKLKQQHWSEQIKGLANLSAETASIFSIVNWDSAEAKKPDLSNPVIQMAQRASSIKQRLVKFLFEAALLDGSAKVIFASYQKQMAEYQYP